MKYTFVIILIGLFIKQGIGQDKKAQSIVDKAIHEYGGKQYKNAHYEYDFRDYHYVFHHDNGKFRYERHHKNASLIDVLTNEGFQRLQDGKAINLSSKDSRKYSNSVNSVNYFAFLPYFLNDAAVIKKYLGKTTIGDTEYNKIQVTFKQEGGGDDHDDVYIYWFDTKDSSMDYIAYSFHVDGGGVRFRKALNARKVGGITFQDYINYKHDKDTPVAALDQLYTEGKLKEVSRIELTNIRPISERGEMR